MSLHVVFDWFAPPLQNSEKNTFSLALMVVLFSVFVATRGTSPLRLISSLDVLLIDRNRSIAKTDKYKAENHEGNRPTE